MSQYLLGWKRQQRFGLVLEWPQRVGWQPIPAVPGDANSQSESLVAARSAMCAAMPPTTPVAMPTVTALAVVLGGADGPAEHDSCRQEYQKCERDYE